MGKEGGATAGGGGREVGGCQLHEKPEADEEPGADIGCPKPGHPGLYLGSRKEHQICRQHSGYGSAGADTAHRRAGIGQYMSQAGQYPASEIEKEIVSMTHTIFDIVAEDEQIPEIADDVAYTGMHEHAAEKGAEL